MSDISTPEPTPSAESTPQPNPSPEPTPTPSPTPQPVEFLVGSDGTFAEGWREKLPEDLGKHSSLDKYESFSDLVKGQINAQSLVGKKAEEFWNSEDPDIVSKRKEIMGIPNDADGYGLQKPELPEEIPFDDVTFGGFAAKAAELGLTKQQAQALVNWDAERATASFEGIGAQMEQQKQAASEELHKTWGNKFDYNIAKVKQATDYLGVTDIMDETGMGNDPRILTAFLEKIVPAISEDKLIEGTKIDNAATVADSLNDVEGRMAKWTGPTTDPKYQAMVKERTALLMTATQRT